jgi:hypothetical protein
MAFSLEMNSTQKVDLGVSITDADNRSVVVTGVVWASSDENIVTLQVAGDTLSAVALSGPGPGLGAFGSAIITTTCTTPFGDLTDTGTITVVATLPESMNLTAGIPVNE